MQLSERKFEINPDNLREAIDFLGIKQPVYIKFHGRRGSTHATYSFMRSWQANKTEHRFFEKWVEETGHPGHIATFHKIVIKSYLSAAAASCALWHELTHAMQAEEEAEGNPNRAEAISDWLRSERRDRRYRYAERPCEIEAREFEAFALELPLTIVGRFL